MSQFIAAFFAFLVAAFISGFNSVEQTSVQPSPIPPEAMSTVDAPAVLTSIRVVTCAYEDQEVGVGTGVVIGKNQIITDEHVIRGMTFCTFEGEVFMAKDVKFKNANVDIAVIDVSTKDIPVVEYSCDRLMNDKKYLGIGYPAGFYNVELRNSEIEATNIFANPFSPAPQPEYVMVPAPVMTVLYALDKYEDFLPTKEDKKRSDHLRMVSGYVRPGMSGGPVLDEDWKIHGLINAVKGSSYGMIRELADTPLCNGR
jgi:hypothetical protein